MALASSPTTFDILNCFETKPVKPGPFGDEYVAVLEEIVYLHCGSKVANPVKIR
jgi:hypothetical protein